MHSSENCKQSRLPKRFPVGSTYVVEGRGGEDGHLRVVSRYVELPGGRRIDVGAIPAVRDLPVAAVGRGIAPKITSKPGKNIIRTAQKNYGGGRNHSPTPPLKLQMPGEAPQPLTLNHPVSNPGRISGRGSSFRARLLPRA